MSEIKRGDDKMLDRIIAGMARMLSKSDVMFYMLPDVAVHVDERIIEVPPTPLVFEGHKYVLVGNNSVGGGARRYTYRRQGRTTLRIMEASIVECNIQR